MIIERLEKRLKTARQLTVEALCRMEKEKSWSNLALDSVLTKAKLSVQDRGFASALFYGTLTRRYTIDSCIEPLSKRPVDKLDTLVLNILRTGIFQLLYLDSVPDHAAVSESVNLCRLMKKSSAAGFVNAVLRGFLRTNKQVPVNEKDSVEKKLAIEYSCPPNLVKYWLEAYGEQNTQIILENSIKAPPTFIRVNPRKTSVESLIKILEQEGIDTKKREDIENCLEVTGQRNTESSTARGALYSCEAYKQGLFHVQDLSSQRCAMSLDTQKGERVLDCCAAPGGKTFIIAQELGDSGEVVACDLYPKRVEELVNRNKRLGLSNIKTHALDMTEYRPELGEFDRVICDAPCSGFGTIRRRPEIKYNDIDSVKKLPELQLKLLENASKYCKNDGILIYSTCTLSPSENKNVVEEFLKNNPNYSLLPNNNDFDQNVENTILLGQDGGDGFYIAIMKHN